MRKDAPSENAHGPGADWSRSDAYGWHFQFLTIIGLSLATVTFAVGLLADLTLSRRLFLFKNLLTVCSAPLEVLISILYWGLKLVRGPIHRFQARQILTVHACRSTSPWWSRKMQRFRSMQVSVVRSCCFFGSG